MITILSVYQTTQKEKSLTGQTSKKNANKMITLSVFLDYPLQIPQNQSARRILQSRVTSTRI